MKGKNLATNGTVNIVKTYLAKGRSRYFGCVLPRGTVHAIGGPVGSDVDGFETTQHIDQVKGSSSPSSSRVLPP